MTRTRMVISALAVLLAGCGLGWFMAGDFRSATPRAVNADRPHPAPMRANSATAETVAESAASLSIPESKTPGSSSDDGAPPVAELIDRLDAERALRLQLKRELEDMRLALDQLRQRFDKLADRRSSAALAAERGRIDASALLAAGFNAADAAYIAQRWGQQQMDLLYLRDQAAREGWLDTPRYRKARDELRSAGEDLWNELGEAAYDRFLYATGRPNRVQVAGVIDSSPAQLLGLQTGDVIFSYDGDRIYSGNDLRTAVSSGEIDAEVTMEILRGDQIIEVSLLRGPIGVQLDAVVMAPL